MKEEEQLKINKEAVAVGEEIAGDYIYEVAHREVIALDMAIAYEVADYLTEIARYRDALEKIAELGDTITPMTFWAEAPMIAQQALKGEED